jgi:hypothetical protein
MPETDEVLFFGYDTNLPGGTEYSRTWDAGTGVYAPTSNQPSDLTPGGFMMWSMWSSGHAFVDTPEGHLLVNGGYRTDVRKAYLFNPGTRVWSVAASSANLRFYPTTITLADGKVMTMYGSGSKNHEIFTPGGSWSAPVAWPAALNHHQYYPWTWVLPDGSLFVAGPHDPTHRVELANPTNNQVFSTVNGNRSTGGEKGSAMLLTLRPPDYRPQVIIVGGNPAAAQKTAEIIDLDDASPAWTSLPDLNVARAKQFTATLLPDGRVMIAGGVTGADGGPAEIYDPQDPAAGWNLGRSWHGRASTTPRNPAERRQRAGRRRSEDRWCAQRPRTIPARLYESAATEHQQRSGRCGLWGHLPGGQHGGLLHLRGRHHASWRSDARLQYEPTLNRMCN